MQSSKLLILVATASILILTPTDAALDDPLFKLLASDGVTIENFGKSVAIDATRAIVGSPGDDSGAFPTPGTAYIYVRNGGVWGYVVLQDIQTSAGCGT